MHIFVYECIYFRYVYFGFLLKRRPLPYLYWIFQGPYIFLCVTPFYVIKRVVDSSDDTEILLIIIIGICKIQLKLLFPWQMEHFNQQWQSIQMEQPIQSNTGKAMGHNVDGKTRQIVKLTMTPDRKACENQLRFRWAFNISPGTHIHRASKELIK